MANLDAQENFQTFRDPQGNPLLAIVRDGSIKFADGSSQSSAAGAGNAGYTVLNVKSAPFNATGNGTTDDSAAIQAAVNAAASNGGGVVFFPTGTYLIGSQLTFPNDSASPAPHQKSIRMVGAGSHFAGIASPVSGASVLNLTYSGTVGKIVTYGLGSLTFEELTLKNTGSDSLPFIYTTNTTLWVNRCSFIGSSTASPLQDAIVLGGQGASVTGDSTGYFQGYGTVIDANYFDYIQRGVLLQRNANAVVIRANSWWTNCAGSAAIEDWNNAGYSNSGLLTSGNLIEMVGYTYGISLHRTGGSTLLGDNFYDGGAFTAYYNFDSAASATNLVIPGFFITGAKLAAGADVGCFLSNAGLPGYLNVFDSAGAFTNSKFKVGRLEIGGGNRLVIRAANDDETADIYNKTGHSVYIIPAQADGQLVIGDNAANAVLTFSMPDGTFTLRNNNAAKYTYWEVQAGASQGTIPMGRWKDVNGNINTIVNSDGSFTFVKRTIEGKTTVAAAATTTLDASTANTFLVTLGTNITSLSISNPADGQTINIIWRQDATGSRTVAFPTSIKGATAPSAGANTSSAQAFVYDSANSAWYALGAGSTGM